MSEICAISSLKSNKGIALILLCLLVGAGSTFLLMYFTSPVRSMVRVDFKTKSFPMTGDLYTGTITNFTLYTELRVDTIGRDSQHDFTAGLNKPTSYYFEYSNITIEDIYIRIAWEGSPYWWYFAVVADHDDSPVFNSTINTIEIVKIIEATGLGYELHLTINGELMRWWFLLVV